MRTQTKVKDSDGRKMLAAQDAAKTVTATDPSKKGQANGSFQRTDIALRHLLIEANKFEKEIEPTVAGISDRLLAIAKRFQTRAGVEEKPDGTKVESRAESFITACKMEEDWLRSKEAGDDQRTEGLPRCWTQAKSNIKAAMCFGIDLSKFETESALRKEKVHVAGLRGKNALPRPVKSAVDSAVESLNGLGEAEALRLVAQFQCAINAALKALNEVMPEDGEPVKAQSSKAVAS